MHLCTPFFPMLPVNPFDEDVFLWNIVRINHPLHIHSCVSIVLCVSKSLASRGHLVSADVSFISLLNLYKISLRWYPQL